MKGKQFLLDDMESASLRWYTVTTQVVNSSDPVSIASAAQAIVGGELVILPTDTVYGIGADALNDQAVRRLFRVKNRPVQKGIPVLIGDLADLERIVSHIPAAAGRLVDRFWPGPLTIIFPKHEELAPSVSITASVAVRMPDHDFTREVIKAGGGALAATSANLSGNAPAITVRDALMELGGSVPIAIDDGPSPGGTASTVVDCTAESIRVLRAGPISLDKLQEVGQR